uniref:FAM20 C-terminal domain-containing protein n=1 Tax=Dendroctonus ponderosae TaxID=77166 RepID=A0AAR5PBZ9_DENPD
MLLSGLRMKERFVLCASVIAVLFTLMLIMDIQMDLGLSRKHLVPSHGRIKTVINEEGPEAAYHSFKNRLLQKTHSGISMNISKENLPNETALLRGEAGRESGAGQMQNQVSNKEQEDDFSDLLDYLMLDTYERGKFRADLSRINPVVAAEETKSKNPTIGELKNINLEKNATTLEKFHMQISQHELYSKDCPLVDELLRQMQTETVLHVAQKSGGTQLKLVIDYPNDLQALFKPMRFPREQQTLPNHFYFTDYERHNAEIAAFHLDRLMGFRRAMPVTGRLLNVTSELYSKAEGDLLSTFFISPSENLCFHGKCSYYCDTSHAICGSPDKLEGSFAAFLPSSKLAPTKVWRHPWRRSYHK